MHEPQHGYHAVNTQTLTTGSGDLLAVHGGCPGSIHEVTQLRHSHFAAPLLASGARVVTDAGCRAAPSDVDVLARRGKLEEPAPGDREITRARAENDRPHDQLMARRVMRGAQIRPCVRIHHITQTVTVQGGPQTHGHRVGDWPKIT